MYIPRSKSVLREKLMEYMYIPRSKRELHERLMEWEIFFTLAPIVQIELRSIHGIAIVPIVRVVYDYPGSLSTWSSPTFWSDWDAHEEFNQAYGRFVVTENSQNKEYGNTSETCSPVISNTTARYGQLRKVYK